MTGIEKLRRQPLGVVVGSLLVVGGGALPWARSGRRDRSSFDLVQFADRNDLLPSSIAWAATAWLVAPLVVAGVVAAVALGRRRFAAGLGTALAAATFGLAAATAATPLDTRFGIGVSLAGAVLVVVDGIRQAVHRPV